MSARRSGPYRDPSRLTGLISYQLKRAYLASNAAYAAALAPLGLSPGHFGLLQAVADDPGLMQRDAAAAIGLDKSTVVPMLNLLEQKGWIERRANADGRARSLWLTEAGQMAIEELRPLIAAHEARVSQGLSPQERAVLVELLKRVRDGITKM